MTNKTLKRLPVGIQTYSEIVDLDCLYIDKTEYILKMLELSKYIFLSRPRRFGKSLLVSTLQSYFEGRRELFKGLYIDSVEQEWRCLRVGSWGSCQSCPYSFAYKDTIKRAEKQIKLALICFSRA